MNDDLISIIIPVYNVEDYLVKCLESVIRQTYRNLDIILIDDGSTDNSGKICDKYKRIDNRIRVIHKMNEGLSAARNDGIELAKGKYIGFVDSDDYIEDDMYEYLYNLIKENQSDIAVCDFAVIKYNKIKKRCGSTLKEIQNINKYDALKLILNKTNVFDFAWNKIYNKDLFNNIKYPVGRTMEDIATTYKLVDISKHVVIGNEIKYYYVQRTNSISHSHDTSQVWIDQYELSYERYQFIKDKKYNLIDNDIVMLMKIIYIYILDNKDVREYIIDNNLKKTFCEILNQNKKQIMKNCTLKMIIKIKLFCLNPMITTTITRLHNRIKEYLVKKSRNM